MILIIDFQFLKLNKFQIDNRRTVINNSTYNKDKIKYDYLVKILKESNGFCCYCQKILTNKNYSVDHKIPKNYFLTNNIFNKVNADNLIICCDECNSKKGGRIYDIQTAYELAEEAYLRIFYENALFIDPKEHTEESRYLIEKYKIFKKNRIRHITKNEL